MTENKVRTRLAPSPTGYPHIGTIYQALFDKAWAVKKNGKFVLRIEDTDQARSIDGAEVELYKALDWFNLNPDESPKSPGDYGPYHQSERLDIYKKYIDQLIFDGNAYPCFCSKERLDKVRKEMQKNGKQPMYDKHCRNLDKHEVEKRVNNGEDHVVRMKIPRDTKIIVRDMVRGDIEFDSNLVDDQVILKTDGFPTYHLAVVVDDHLMGISDIVRGQEWITSFPKHKILYEYLGWKMPPVLHTPLISNMDGSKLSKRQGHSSVDWYRRKGFLPEAVLNFISLLGWSHPDEKEIFDFDEFVEMFELREVSAVSPKFDLTKLEWMNGQYIKEYENDELIEKIIEWLKYCIDNDYKGAGEYETEWKELDYKLLLEFIEKLTPNKQELFAEINKERIKKFEDLLPLNEFFIHNPDVDISLLRKDRELSEVIRHLNWVEDELKAIPWELDRLKELETEIVQKAHDMNWKVGEVFYPIRMAICGSRISPPLFESIYILGRYKTMTRLGNFSSD